jgi:hypothetical protein
MMTVSRRSVLKGLAAGFIATGVPAGAVGTEEELGFYRFATAMTYLSLLMATAFVAATTGWCNGKQQPVAKAAAPIPTQIHARFPLTESPISEGGRWLGGKTAGLDWRDISTTPGFAIGHAGPKRFADATALLKGNWGPTQTAEAVVVSKAVYNYPEVSLRLRSSLSAHRCTGYEISNSLRKGKSAYLIIVRWNGPLADFTYLAQVGGAKYGVTTGDVVRATIASNVITAYKNGVELARVTDKTYSSGNPGMGFNKGINGEYRISRFTATDAPIRVHPQVGHAAGE